jgi:hypothetical protein
MDDQGTNREGGGSMISDDEIRRELEQGGRLKLENWFVAADVVCYSDENGASFAIADDEPERSAAIIDFLRRLGQVRNNFPAT